MPQFAPIRQPFQIDGVDLVRPPDRMPPGKFPFALNARSVLEGTATSRPGYGAPVNASPFDQLNVHSIRRMNNYLPGASPAYRRFVGAGTKLYSADAGVIDTGYSGNPLSMVLWRPDQSVEPWMYVCDSQKMRKCRMNGATQTNYQVGIAPPTVAPQVQLDQPFYTPVSDFPNNTGWVAGGTAGSISGINRSVASTTVYILNFDNDPFTGFVGWCNVSPTNSALNYGWIGAGARLTIGGELVTVQEVHTENAPSTILGIVYDAGSTGYCTIQAATPLRGLTRNSVVVIFRSSVVNTSGTAVTWVSGNTFDVSAPDPTISINGVIYTIASVNSPTSITLTGSAGTQTGVAAATNYEAPNVLSVTIGPDGLYSFRCITQFTQIAGVTVAQQPSFRVYFQNPGHAAGESITATAIASAITKGVGTLSQTVALDLSQAGGRPLSPEDYLHISVWVDVPGNLTEGRILTDVDAVTNNFLQNFYYFPFRPADNTAALTGGISSLQALQTAATNLIIGEVQSAIPSPAFVNATDPQIGIGVPDVLVPDSQQLFSGNSAWTEILIPYSDLQRAGGDATRSIANVEAIQLWFNCIGTINVKIAAWWVGGSYGPNSNGPTAQPLLYRYRYRSTLTGAKSQQSPATRAVLQTLADGTIVGSSNGAIAFRQQVLVYPAASADPQVDQIDIERYGGVLNEWHFAGTISNSATVFADAYSDDDIKTNPALETDAVMPFVSFDVPRTGTCNVVGTQVSWASGDNFSTSWAPGQEILIAGIPYIVYGQPSSATALSTVENVGVLTGVPFLVAEPTLIGQPLPHIIGPFDQGNFLLAWGDPRNPGVVYATKGGDPDSAPIPYYLELCDPSEPIVGGVIWDNNAIVASTKRFWRISIDANAVASGQGNVLVKQELQVGRGLFAPWAICAGPVIWFLDEAGVPCITNGAQAQSIVEDDLRPLFPHDDTLGVAVNNLIPPDLTATTALRMSYSNGKMKFFFKGTDGNQWTWIYDYTRKGWLPSQFAVQMNLAYWEEGESLDSELMGGQDGNIYQVGGFSDNGTPIAVAMYTPILNGGNPRTQKFWGDDWLDVDTQGVANLNIQLGFNLFANVMASKLIPATVGRQNYPLNINSSNGFLGQNAQAFIYWSSATAAPVLYEWQPWAWDTGTVLRTSWVSLPTSHGVDGWQHLRDGYVPILMPTAGTVDLVVTLDGNQYFSALNLPLEATANLLQKLRIDFPPAKGLMFQYQLLNPTSPFLVFEKDLEIYTKSWGSAGPYVKVRPFADPAFVS